MSRAARQLSRGAVVAVVAGAVVLALASTVVVGGLSGGFRVRGRTFGLLRCSPPTLAGSVVQVTLRDAGSGGRMMGGGLMMVSLHASPGGVASGQVSFVARNAGGLVHELVVLPLPADGPGTRPTGADGKIDESQSLGESSRSCAAGAGDGIAPGATGWVTVTLAPGRYELVCDEPWHYANGMFDVVTVA